jgi:hypothetical protein
VFKALRIAVLLIILATVAQEAWLARARAVSWQDTLRVAIYPINGDGSEASADYLRRLPPEAFEPIERFFDDEARRHGRQLHRPVEITVAPVLADQPPQPPRAASVFDSLLWSLHMRYWAWRHDAVPGVKPRVRLFVRFFDPASHAQLPHSVGVTRGMIGLINAYASQSMAGSNAVIVTHELLHTLGASDKYNPADNQPRYPDGYAEPGREPRYPQEFAEIMGGRIPVTESRSKIPEGLQHTMIGAATAAEIGWTGQR